MLKDKSKTIGKTLEINRLISSIWHKCTSGSINLIGHQIMDELCTPDITHEILASETVITMTRKIHPTVNSH